MRTYFHRSHASNMWYYLQNTFPTRILQSITFFWTSELSNAYLAINARSMYCIALGHIFAAHDGSWRQEGSMAIALNMFDLAECTRMSRSVAWRHHANVYLLVSNGLFTAQLILSAAATHAVRFLLSLHGPTSGWQDIVGGFWADSFRREC